MIGWDLGERAKRTVAGVEWTLALLPWGKLAELRARFADAHAAASASGTAAQVDVLASVYAEMVRWGVKSWNTPVLPRETETVEFAGVRYEVLSAQLVDFLLHINGGGLVADLALAVLEVNRLPEDVLTGFRSASPG